MEDKYLNNKDNFIPRLFLHFLDLYHYHLAKNIYYYPENLIYRELWFAFRLSSLFSKEVFIPASAYFENALTRKIIKEHPEFSEAGFIFLSSGEPSLAEHFEKKRKFHYDTTSTKELQKSYNKLTSIPVLYKEGNIKTSKTIIKNWNEIINSGTLIQFLDPKDKIKFSHNFEEAWFKIPELIGKRAFVVSHVIQAFNKLGVVSPSELNLLKVLDPAFSQSYAEPLQCGLVDDLLYTQTPWSIKNTYIGFSYKKVRDKLIHYQFYDSLKYADCEKLLRLKLSQVWNAIIPTMIQDTSEIDNESQECISEIKKFLSSNDFKQTKALPNDNVSQIGIVTALPEEWIAITSCLNAQEIKNIKNDPNKYAIACMNFSEATSKKILKIVVTFLPRMGTNSAATVTTNLLRSFPNVNDIIFSGIACGCPFPTELDKHVRLGDIVVSDLRGVIQLDIQSVKDNTIENRSSMPLPSRNLLNAVRLLEADALENKFSWNTILDELVKRNKLFKRPNSLYDVLHDKKGQIINHPKDIKRKRNYPKVFYGAVGSSNSLLRNRKIRVAYSKKYNLRAIEMEGAGTAEAVWQFGKNYLIVRGICDYGDSTKNDKWHYYAAAVAAAFTKAILERIIKTK